MKPLYLHSVYGATFPRPNVRTDPQATRERIAERQQASERLVDRLAFGIALLLLLGGAWIVWEVVNP